MESCLSKAEVASVGFGEPQQQHIVSTTRSSGILFVAARNISSLHTTLIIQAQETMGLDTNILDRGESDETASTLVGPCRFLVPGNAQGEIVFSEIPISFMMGVDAETGIVQDEHHPLCGTGLKNKIVVIPQGRGSCAASGVILELLFQGNAPAAFIFKEPEEILTLGILLAEAMFAKSIPVVLVEDSRVWALLARGGVARICDGKLCVQRERIPLSPPYLKRVTLTPADEKLLRGEECSFAATLAMKLIVEFASIQGAEELIDVSQVHIDACCYVGKTSLLVPERLLELGAKVVVPSTCNSLDADRQRWRELGSDPSRSIFAVRIGDAYLAMGAKMSFTCAPYLLDSRPKAGEQVGWAESNAVVFANSVLGARTQKYPDYLDVLIALTGRAPSVGCHLPEGRVPQMKIQVPELKSSDDSVFPILGYLIGEVVGNSIPIIYGLERTNPGVPDLKAFSAGFATTSSSPMFHINGVTPEAATVEVPLGLQTVKLDFSHLIRTWKTLNTATDNVVDIISLGNPHFALEEFPRLIKLIENHSKQAEIDVVITTNRFVYQKAAQAGYLKRVEQFGARVITDTCWCMLQEPVIPHDARNIMTNSAKYAHYGPGLSKRKCHFGSMAGCVEAACTGYRTLQDQTPKWLFGEQ